MKNDKKINDKILEINEKTSDFISAVKSLGNQCAATDRIVEAIIKLGKELEELHNNNFCD